MFHKYRFYAPMYGWAGSTWFRLTASVYNEMADYELIRDAVSENCDRRGNCHETEPLGPAQAAAAL